MSDEPREPAPGSVPQPPSGTGAVPGVHRARERLADISTANVHDHVEIYDDVQRELHRTLAELDDS
jgi:hypothetical protein